MKLGYIITDYTDSEYVTYHNITSDKIITSQHYQSTMEHWAGCVAIVTGARDGTGVSIAVELMKNG
jgi:hypothetical protein